MGEFCAVDFLWFCGFPLRWISYLLVGKLRTLRRLIRTLESARFYLFPGVSQNCWGLKDTVPLRDHCVVWCNSSKKLLASPLVVRTERHFSDMNAFWKRAKRTRSVAMTKELKYPPWEAIYGGGKGKTMDESSVLISWESTGFAPVHSRTF